MVRRRAEEPLPTIGWREWLWMPDLAEACIKAKVDTGARSSALHAFDLERERIDGVVWVRFSIHPAQRSATPKLEVSAPLADERWVRSSSGKETLRPVIRTRLRLGAWTWPIELTLVRRDLMGFRMLLGRQAVRRRFLVDPGRSFLTGKSPKTRAARRRREEDG